jgi:hypothetical protein
LEVFILKSVSARGITIKIEDHRRLPDSFGLHHIEVEGIPKPPLNLEQFHRVARVIVDVANQRRSWVQIVISQRRRSPVLLHATEARVGWIGDRWGRWLKLSDPDLRQE